MFVCLLVCLFTYYYACFCVCLPCHALPCLAMPCLALPRLALPFVSLPACLLACLLTWCVCFFVCLFVVCVRVARLCVCVFSGFRTAFRCLLFLRPYMHIYILYMYNIYIYIFVSSESTPLRLLVLCLCVWRFIIFEGDVFVFCLCELVSFGSKSWWSPFQAGLNLETKKASPAYASLNQLPRLSFFPVSNLGVSLSFLRAPLKMVVTHP